MLRSVRAILPSTLACALAALAGCSGGSPDEPITGEDLTVYVSVPLRGAHAAQGQAIEDGAKLALADAGGRAGKFRMEVSFLDDTGGDPPKWNAYRTADNARRAAQDSRAIAYIGEFDSGATRVSLPITNEAGMPHVAPASPATDLNSESPRFNPTGERTFARLIPNDAAQARAAAGWAKRSGARRAAAITDRSEFGIGAAAAFSDEAQRLGIGAGEGSLKKLRPDVVYFAAEPDTSVKILRRAAKDAPGAEIYTTDAILEPGILEALRPLEDRLRVVSGAIAPEKLPPEGREFVKAYEKEFGKQPDAYAAYGYEAMALVLDVVRRAGDKGDDRRELIENLKSTRGRRSILGTYSIRPDGNTTLRTVSGLRIRNGRPKLDRELEAPAG